MSEFRIFCIGAMMGNLVAGIICFVLGPPSGLLAPIYLAMTLGVIAVALFGPRSA